MLKDYYKTEEIAETLGCTKETVYLLRDYGLLHMSRFSRSFGTDADELHRLLEWARDKDLTNEDRVRFWAIQQKAQEC